MTRIPEQKKEMMDLPVIGITDETPDTKTFRLGLGSGSSIPFQPGQFIIVRADIWNPKKNRPTALNRAFSISSSPLEKEFIEFTVKKYQDGRMTPWLHEEIRAGHILSVKGPSGSFVFQEGVSDEIVLIAGGIGVAPYRSMIRYILHGRLPVAVRLIYSARTPHDFAYKTEFDTLSAQHGRFQCLYTVTREHVEWTGRVGRVDAALLREYQGNTAAVFYLCGPDEMIDRLRINLETLGIPQDRIRSEKW
jgi:ferredoxin-NADP reductase